MNLFGLTQLLGNLFLFFAELQDLPLDVVNRHVHLFNNRLLLSQLFLQNAPTMPEFIRLALQLRNLPLQLSLGNR